MGLVQGLVGGADTCGKKTCGICKTTTTPIKTGIASLHGRGPRVTGGVPRYLPPSLCDWWCTIAAVSFLLPLKPAMVTNMSMVRLHVRAQASGGVAHVSWMVRGKEVSSGARYVIYTDPGPHNTTFSTLAISGVSDADTRSEVTAIASFRNKTDFSTTQLIRVRKFKVRVLDSNLLNFAIPRVATLENLTVNCNGVFLVQFDLPETFPLFRELNGIMAVNITLIFMFCHVTDIQNTFNSTISISASNYRDLTSHGVYLNREHFPSDGRYRLQARLSINGQEVQEFSSLCNRERNVYPSTTDCKYVCVGGVAFSAVS